MLSILRHYQLPLHFPKEVLREAQGFPAEVETRDLAGRVDARGQSVITIDPDDAKDFDDAICLESAGADHWKLWVHIADVSHYVKPGSALDVEARRRGNSTYLVDRVIPMLPEALSNELCSLKPHVDRLTRCVEFLLTAEGRVVRAQFYPSIIRSQRRFTYGEVLTILQRPPMDPIERMVHAAHRMTQRIRRARMQAGSLELDFPENKIRLDEQGHILRIERVENDISHQLVEECMLLANEAVARELQRLERPALYRIHEAPAEDRLEEFREEVVAHRIACGNLTHRPEVQKLLAKLHKLPAGDALKIGFLKSLMRARYAVEPLGHYGLAKKHYTHFTSPIRRYADLVVHRGLFAKAGPRAVAGSLKETAEHISETERNSSDAERDSKQVKLFAHLANQLKTGRLERYPALVIDVRNFGFFVDLPTLGLSGLVHLSVLQDDFYQFDFNRSQLVGRRTRRVIQLGDRLEVEVANVETYKKQVDFRLAGTIARPVGRGSQPERSRERGRDRNRTQETPRQPKRGPLRPQEKQPRPEPQGRRRQESQSGGNPARPPQPPHSRRRSAGSRSGSRRASFRPPSARAR